MNQKYRHGDTVSHRIFGVGRVLCEWGNFRACKSCYRESPLGAKYRIGYCTDGTATQLFNHKSANPPCPHCQGPTFVIKATNIYDVRFADGKTRAVNFLWLMPGQQIAAPTVEEVSRELSDFEQFIERLISRAAA
jgi:hypothetical protein